MKSKLLIPLLALLILTTAQITFGQDSQAPLATDLSRTYGYINGQRFKLNRIKKEFPDLGIFAQKAELEFQTAFGTAERNINVALQELLAAQFLEYVSKMNTQLETLLSSQPLNRELGADFIAEVESRAKGKIESPVLETLLTYEFIERPVDEVAQGYSRVFRTQGHPKAKDTKRVVPLTQSRSRRSSFIWKQRAGCCTRSRPWSLVRRARTRHFIRVSRLIYGTLVGLRQT